MKNYSNYEQRKVVITVDKNVTLARIFDDNNKVVAKGVANCSPEDTFDFQMGAELAMKRAFESIPKKEEKKQEWKVVRRKVNVGDYIRVTYKAYSFGDYGEILKVHEVDDFGNAKVLIDEHPKCKKYITENHNGKWPRNHWVYLRNEFEVVEPVKEYRKLNRPPRAGDYIRLTKVHNPFDRVGDVLKIVDSIGGGFVVAINPSDHPRLIEYYGGIENVYKNTTDKRWRYSVLFDDYEFVEEVTE